jgi:hypothetical protein
MAKSKEEYQEDYGERILKSVRNASSVEEEEDCTTLKNKTWLLR